MLTKTGLGPRSHLPSKPIECLQTQLLLCFSKFCYFGPQKESLQTKPQKSSHASSGHAIINVAISLQAMRSRTGQSSVETQPIVDPKYTLLPYDLLSSDSQPSFHDATPRHTSAGISNINQSSFFFSSEFSNYIWSPPGSSPRY